MDCTCTLHGERTDFHGKLSERVDLKDEDIARQLPYLITPCSRVLTEKLAGFQLVKKFPTFWGTRRFSTAFTNARQLSLSWGSSIQSMPPHPTSWISILILSSHLRLGLPSGLFPSDFLTKALYTPLLSPISNTCPAQLILLDFITRTILGEDYISLSSIMCSFLQSIDRHRRSKRKF